MKNEKGITLIELLAAVVIAGIVIVPLLTIMTGTFTRTISQEKETEIAYVAQEVMEKVRLNVPNTPVDSTDTNYLNFKLEEKVYCYPSGNPIYVQKGITCNEELPSAYHPATIGESFLTAEVKKYDSINYPNMLEVKITVFIL